MSLPYPATSSKPSSRRSPGVPSLAVLAVASLVGGLVAACSVETTNPQPTLDGSVANNPDASPDGASFDAAADVTSDVQTPVDATTDAALDAGDGGDAADARSPIDPAPFDDAPGKHRSSETCADTTTYDSTGYDIALPDAGTATSRKFEGTVTGQTGAGTYYVRGPNGEEITGPVPTSTAGAYSLTLPMFCGANLVKLVWPGASECTLVVVLRVLRSACEPADIQATINWDDLGRDWELHLIKPGGTLNDNATDCTWTSCLGSSGPDWGVSGDTSDNPHKDVDNTGAYGPENIYLSKPEVGTYTLMVEHWGTGQPSNGQLIVNVQGSTTVIPRTALVSHHVWKAATITWPGKVVTPLQDDVDCTKEWSSGCPLKLP